MKALGLDIDSLASDATAPRRHDPTIIDRIINAKYVGSERVTTDGGFTFIGGNRVRREGGFTYIGDERVWTDGGFTFIGKKRVTIEGSALYVDGKRVQE